MASTEGVEREVAARPHPCCCVMSSNDVSELRCNNYVSSPDVPFCSSCESRHPDLSPGITVGAQLPTVGK
jgi:hypothetical protein